MAAISSIVGALATVAGATLQAKSSRDARKDAARQAAEQQRQANLAAQGNAMAQQNAIEARNAQQQVMEAQQQAASQTEQLDVSSAAADPERNRRTVRQQFQFDAGSAAGSAGGVRV